MSEKFVILADATCELSEELRNYFKVEDYLRGHVYFGEDRELSGVLDWSEIDRATFYKGVGNKKMKVTTSPPSPDEVFEIFKGYVENGTKVISMAMSSKISSSYDHMVKAAEMIDEKYGKGNVYCVDSCRMSGSFGLLVIYAHIQKNEGKSYQEVIDWVEENKYKIHQMGPIDDLMFVARRGRISMGKAIMGSFAGVKPMGDCNTVGYATVLGKVKGINKSLDITVAYAEKIAIDIQNQYVTICHSDREEIAMKLKELVEQKLSPKKVFVTDLFPFGGANVGPGMICLNFFGDKVSEDNAVEKEVFAKILESAK